MLTLHSIMYYYDNFHIKWKTIRFSQIFSDFQDYFMASISDSSINVYEFNGFNFSY